MRHIFRDLFKRDMRLLLNGGLSFKQLGELIMRLPLCVFIPFISPRIKKSYYLSVLKFVKASLPLEIHIENTNVCDANCIMCPREKMTRNIGFMEYEFFCKIIDQIISTWSIDSIHLHGFGEPLFDRELPEKIAYSKKRNIKDTYIVTTASRLTEEMAVRLINSGLDRMKISISGSTKESYEEIHKGLIYKDVEENILSFLSVRKNMDQKKPRLILQFLPQDKNRHEEDDFFKKWGQLIDHQNGDTLTKFGLHNWVRGKSYREINNSALKRRSCGWPFRVMQILWNGDVVPCCYDFNGDMVLSSLKECSIEEAWNSLHFKKLRALHLSREFNELELCNKCDQLDVI